MCLARAPRERRGADFTPQGCWRAKEALEFCGRVCAVLTFLRDKSRAPAAIVVGALNTYPGCRRRRHLAARNQPAKSATRSPTLRLIRRAGCPALRQARCLVSV